MLKCEFYRKGAETPKRKKRNEVVVANGKGTGVFPHAFAAETLILVLRDMCPGSYVRPFHIYGGWWDKKVEKRKKKSKIIISDTVHSFNHTNYVRLQCNLVKNWERGERKQKWHKRWKYASLPTGAILWHCERFDASSEKSIKMVHSVSHVMRCMPSITPMEYIVSTKQKQQRKAKETKKSPEKDKNWRKKGKKEIKRWMEGWTKRIPNT